MARRDSDIDPRDAGTRIIAEVPPSTTADAPTAERPRADAAPAKPAVEPVPAAETPSRPAPDVAKAPVDAPVAAPAAPPAPVKKKRGKARWIVLLLAAGALAYGGKVGQDYWNHGRFIVETDDAYVSTDITTLSAKVAGYVQSVDVTTNQSVKAGDPIAHIDAGDFQLALTSAENKIRSQDAAIARIDKQIAAARAGVAQAEAQVASVKAGLAQAEANFARQQQLVANKVTAQAQLDEARAGRDQAAAAVTAAEAGVEAAKANVAVLEAQSVEARTARADLVTARDKAARDLSFTVVRAPVDGIVGNRAVEVGAYIQPGQRLAALVPLSEVHIDANFKETQLGEIRPGETVEITVDALPGRVIEGKVESFAPATGSVFSLLPPENATGNFTKIIQRVPVRIAIPADVAAEGLLRPGMSVVAGVDTRTGG